MNYDKWKVWDNYFKNKPRRVLERSVKGTVLKGKDDFGTEIAREAYGQENSKYGWDVDHIDRRRTGGGNELSNLRPLHISNNRRRD